MVLGVGGVVAAGGDNQTSPAATSDVLSGYPGQVAGDLQA
jgi:hypothetical protein